MSPDPLSPGPLSPGPGFDPDRAAAALLDARGRRQRLPPLDGGLRPPDLAAGVAVQRALAGRVGAVPPAGFKIGATARRMQEYLGLDGPAAGFMPREGLHESGAVLGFADFLAVGVECELAVRLGRDLAPAPCTPDAAADAVGEFFAAIEIVENRYPDLAALGTPTLVADQVFHAAAVLGAAHPGWRGLDLVAVRGRITVDGAERGAGQGGDLLGDPMRALAWLAGSEVAAAFGGLRAGQVVLLGSVTPPIWLDAPGAVEVAFPPLPPVHLAFR
jgi:2-keto-4-pentenoate hydratase